MSTDRSPAQSPYSPSLRDSETVEVIMDQDEAAPVESLPTFPNAQLDFQNLSISQLFDTLTNGQLLPTSPALLSSPGVGARAGARAGAGAEKRTRSKILINGYFMSYDKSSSNGEKIFWRCEYKNTCKARLHTDVDIEEIVQFVHEHNHSKATDDEIKLYGLDPSAIVEDRVYKIDKVADPAERRKIRKRAAERELEPQNQIDTLGTSALLSFMNSITEGQSSSSLMNGESSQGSSSSSSTLSRAPSSFTPPSENHLMETTFGLALKLIKIWKPALEGRPKSAKNSTTYFRCFVSKHDRLDECGVIRIEQRDENHLKEALEKFCGQKCIGQVLFVVSPKVRIVLNQPMINDWENDQFFLLDSSNPSRWFFSCIS